MAATDRSILAVVAGVESGSHVLAAAIDRAERESASLVVLHVMPDGVFEESRTSIAGSRDLAYDGFTFTHEQAVEAAEGVATRAATAAIGDRELSYTAVGRVGRLVANVLAVAAAHDCGTVFLPAETSWFRRVVGRADRKIASRFDGTVVRVPAKQPDNLKTTRPLPSEQSRNASE